jgi:hypothetical protein
MFRTAFFIAAIFGFCLTGSISAQEVECSVVVSGATDETVSDGSIMLTITMGNPDFTVYLFDKAPWKGGTQLQKIEHVSAKDLIIEELPYGEYYVIVEDKDHNPWAKAVALGIKPN